MKMAKQPLSVRKTVAALVLALMMAASGLPANAIAEELLADESAQQMVAQQSAGYNEGNASTASNTPADVLTGTDDVLATKPNVLVSPTQNLQNNEASNGVTPAAQENDQDEGQASEQRPSLQEASPAEEAAPTHDDSASNANQEVTALTPQGDGGAGQTITKTATSEKTTAGPLTVTTNNNGIVYAYSTQYYNFTSEYFSCAIDASQTPARGTLKITSSNTGIVSLHNSSNASISIDCDWREWRDDYICLDMRRPGKSTITVSYTEQGGNTYIIKFVAVVCPSGSKVTSAAKAGYNTVKVAWEKSSAATGYYVYRTACDEYGYDVSGAKLERVSTVVGDKNTCNVKAPWNKYYRYSVVPYYTVNNYTVTGEGGYGTDYGKVYCLPTAQARITSIKQSGSNKLVVAWSAEAGASSFQVLRSTKENYGYAKIATIGSRTYTDKVTPGITYYYKIAAVYSGVGTATSGSVGKMIPKYVGNSKTGASALGNAGGGGQYGSNWAHADTSYTYSQDGRVYAINLVGKRITILGYTAGMKQVYKKVVTLPAYDTWGGFYHGPDGNNYVAIGFNNPKESKTKTVIQFIKYDKNWVKGKVGTVAGGASNVFTGIYSPFDAGSASFDMNGSTLYVLASRLMFMSDDGLRHQSNIGFSINTNTMKVTVSNPSYASHSFNQWTRFKDGSLFLADHGDAFPREMSLTVANSYGTQGSSISSYTLFDLLGTGGANFTGAQLGGMEVSPTTVLSCGTAQPHGYKVAGVTGFGYNYHENVYLTVTNRTTGKTQVTWLTNYNPKTSKVSLGEARMVKIDDDHFGILYSTQSGNANTLYYVVVNSQGKRLASRIYFNKRFTASSQPVVTDGSIWWIDGDKDNYTGASVYRIPAITWPSVSDVLYKTHVQTYGWQGWKLNGQSSGTTGKAKRLEGINIKLANKDATGSILYRTHVQTYGWEKGWKKDGAMSGTSGKAKRLEAIQIKLSGNLAKKYDVYYRVHAQHFGWMGWAKNGTSAGTAGYAYRLEAIQIRLVARGGKAPGSTSNAFRQR